MADRPILFSAPMIRALLDGRKSQTRQVLNPQPPKGARYTGIHFASDEPDSYFFNSASGPFKARQRIVEGDRLWVREAWRTAAHLDRFAPSVLPVDSPIFYEADAGGDPIGATGRRRAGMHMPRWASRITLTATEVRVQRLQEISEEDAIAEGVGLSAAGQAQGQDGVTLYRHLWDSLNAKRAPWSSNPWVVALTFTTALRNIDAGAD